MTTTKTAQALIPGDVIIMPTEVMPLQVDDVILAGKSVAVFYFTGREHTTLNLGVETGVTILDGGETFCEDHGIVRLTDQGEEADYSWCTLSCGCLYEDEEY